MPLATLVFSIDTDIRALNPTTVYETGTPNYAGEANNLVGNIIRFLAKNNQLGDGTTIPTNAVVNGATLYLYFTNDLADNAGTYFVYRPLRAWDGTSTTWNNYAGANAWGTAGAFGAADCEQTAIGTLTYAAAESVNAWKAISLTPGKIQEFISGAFSNNGYLIKSSAELNDAFGFSSEDSATNKPYIIVNYELGATNFFQCIIAD